MTGGNCARGEGGVPEAGSPVSGMVRDQRGFTIIEVVVAVIILALAYATVLQNFSLSLRNIDRVDKKRTALFEQQLQFEEQLQQAAFSEEEEPDAEIFLEGGRYRVVVLRNETGELASLLTENKQ